MTIEELKRLLIERKNVLNFSEIERITTVSRKKLTAFINNETMLNVDEFNKLNSFAMTFFSIEVENVQ
mgnify:CR=1 FL=1